MLAAGLRHKQFVSGTASIATDPPVCPVCLYGPLSLCLSMEGRESSAQSLLRPCQATVEGLTELEAFNLKGSRSGEQRQWYWSSRTGTRTCTSRRTGALCLRRRCRRAGIVLPVESAIKAGEGPLAAFHCLPAASGCLTALAQGSSMLAAHPDQLHLAHPLPSTMCFPSLSAVVRCTRHDTHLQATEC